MSPMYHRNTRNPHMVAEQEFRTTTPEPASQRPRRRDSQPHTSQQGSQEMLENATSVTTFGEKDTAAESQSHAAHSSRAGHHQSTRFSRDAGECHVGRTLW